MSNSKYLPKRTSVYPLYEELGARVIDFAGWEMPVDFGSVVAEHLTVRENAGLFDVSHMGEFHIDGPGALELLQRLTPNDVSRLVDGQAQYSALTTKTGCFIDDILIYRRQENSYLIVGNASNIDKDFNWIESHADERVKLKNASDDFALLSIQGPKAFGILQPITDIDLSVMKYYRFADGQVLGEAAMVSRTGYTGENGFEIMVASELGEKIARELLVSGASSGLKPIGLAARDTLRLEAKMALYGNDIDDEHTVLEADLGWIVKWEKGDFIGREALKHQKEFGIERKLVGFEMVDRGIARQGYSAILNGDVVGVVTSGSVAPYLKKNIGLVYLPINACSDGTEFEIEIRSRSARAQVVPTPFYKRGQ